LYNLEKYFFCEKILKDFFVLLLFSSLPTTVTDTSFLCIFIKKFAKGFSSSISLKILEEINRKKVFFAQSKSQKETQEQMPWQD
jgi:hypothetical protein